MLNWIQLKMILRGWMCNRVYFVIALLSLVVGLACSILLVGFVMDEYKVAGHTPDSERLFLLQQNDAFSSEGLKTNSSDKFLAVELRSVYPEVEGICVFHTVSGEVNQNGEKKYVVFYAVMPDFADFFTPKVLAGDLRHTLQTPTEVAVTRSYALKLWGREDVMGESLHLEYYKMPEKGGATVKVDQVYTVTSILDDRGKSFLNYPFLIGLPTTEFARKGVSINSYFNFIKLKTGVSGRAFEQKVNQDTLGFGSRFYNPPQVHLVEMNQVYFADEENQRKGLLVTRDRSLLFIGMSVGLVVLLLACFNYINISMTRSLQRLRNIGQQMVFGASGREMRRILLFETGLQVGIAFLVALGLLYLFLSDFNGFMNTDLTLKSLFEGQTLWVILLLLIVVIVVPSLYLFSKMDHTSLSGILRLEFRRRSGLITSMVIAQFFVSLVLLITVLNIHHQMYFIGHARQDADSIYSLQINENSEQWDNFRDRLKEVPGIEKITFSSPLSTSSIGMQGKNIHSIYADSDFYDFYTLDFVAGGPVVGNSDREYQEVVVNETLIQKFGIREPIGHQFEFNGKYKIVGVVRDFPFDHFSKTIEPLMIEGREGWNVCIKVQPGTEKITFSRIQSLWKEVESLPITLECKTMSQLYEDMHANTKRLLSIVWFFTWVSVCLTCLGLFGLAWFSVEQRKKEIGIRKINGATEIQVIELLCSRFVKWICWAFVLAFPVAYWLVYHWMRQFVYQCGIQWWTFAVALGTVVFAGVITVIWQSWKAAIVNPAEVVKID